MKSKQLRRYLVFGLILFLVACSSQKPKENESTDIIPAASDAGTDALPVAAAEAPPVPAGTEPDPNVPPANDPTPSPPADPVAASSGSENYTVQGGDTLMKIAFEVYGDVFKWKDIYEANKDLIHDPNRVPKGISLRIDKPSDPVAIDKNGERYLIKTGDTLGKISNQLYGTESRWKELWEHNKKLIRNPNRIFAGFYLYYTPDAGAAPTNTTQPLAQDSGADAQPSAQAAQPGAEAGTAANTPVAGAAASSTGP